MTVTALLMFYLVILSIAQNYKSWYGDISFFGVVRRIVSGNFDIINFCFASLNSKQIVPLKMIFNSKGIFLCKGASFCATIYQFVALDLNILVR